MLTERKTVAERRFCACLRAALIVLTSASIVTLCNAQRVDINWGKIERVSNTTPTLQVVVNPPLRPGSPIHDRAYAELRAFGGDYVRYVPWLPYPKLAVAELMPPSNGRTSWDFSLIDPLTVDFFNATAGHPAILNFSTIPSWMFKTAKPVEYPQDPNAATWNYTQGTELRDPSMKELSDYYARLVGWYVTGGFTDELGKRHDSGHHFKIPYWEVLNEVDFEHNMTAEQYTARYDAVVSAIRKVSPETKFVGLALAMPSLHPEMFEYFLNPKNHKAGIPLDMISYHFYASPKPDETPVIQQHTFFAQADGFLNSTRYIEQIRKRLAPATRTTVNEVGCISADDGGQEKPGHVTAPIPNAYWNLCGATFAYVLGNLASMGIDVVGESQLVGYPTQFPSVTMVDWTTGAPNARFRVLELLKTDFGPGDKIVATKSDSAEIYALGFLHNGKRSLLLINKRDHDVQVTLPQKAQEIESVDVMTKGGPISKQAVNGDKVTLHAYSVSVANIQ